MITVAILINGHPIVAKNAVRQRDLPDENGNVKYKTDSGEIVLHKPSDGANVLAKKLLDMIRNDD